MATSKVRNNILALKLASDTRYKFQKNGVIKKRGADGKYREVGTERHGYRVISYQGTKIVAARAIAAKYYLDEGKYSVEDVLSVLATRVLVRRNGVSTDDRRTNLVDLYPRFVSRNETKRLSRRQIDRMVELFTEGFSVAKIARRFRRRISRSNISRVIRRELGVETSFVGA